MERATSPHCSPEKIYSDFNKEHGTSYKFHFEEVMLERSGFGGTPELQATATGDSDSHRGTRP